jgi:hypothetical protein
VEEERTLREERRKEHKAAKPVAPTPVHYRAPAESVKAYQESMKAYEAAMRDWEDLERRLAPERDAWIVGAGSSCSVWAPSGHNEIQTRNGRTCSIKQKVAMIHKGGYTGPGRILMSIWTAPGGMITRSELIENGAEHLYLRRLLSTDLVAATKVGRAIQYRVSPAFRPWMLTGYKGTKASFPPTRGGVGGLYAAAVQHASQGA